MTTIKPENMATGNQQYKDSVFRNYLSTDKVHIQNVYRAVSKNRTVKAEDIEINTLKYAFTHTTYNDLSFIVDNKLIVLMEHQSTINNNMPLRMIDYINQLYINSLPSRDLLYQKDMIPLPTPEFYVFYNGTKYFPDYKQLRLSDAFKVHNADPKLELVVDVFNINYDENREILKDCKELHDYSYLVDRIRQHQKDGKTLDDAILIAINDCLKNNIMSDYIQKHQSEVLDIMKLTWNFEDAIEYERETSEARGKAIGEAIGEARGEARGTLNSIKSLMETMGLSLEQAMTALNVPSDQAVKYAAML